MTEKDKRIAAQLLSIVNKILSGYSISNVNFDEIEQPDNQELRELSDDLISLMKQYLEGYQFIIQLAGGMLNIEPPRRNSFVNPFKQLHSELRHLTWQIQQISEGDYDQKVSFSGDFSDAINKMTNALREKQKLAETIKENEFLFRSIFDTSPDGMFICDLEYNILNMSNSAKKMLQLTDDDLNKNYLELIDKDDINIKKWFFNELFSENNTAFAEVKLVRKDGTNFWCEQNAGIVHDSKGIPKGFFVIIRDISRRKADEEQIIKFTMDLKESNATKDKLFSIIAHDLKNPFQALLGLSDILVREVSSENIEEIKYFSKIINESAKRGYELLVNLLNWARVQSGNIKTSKLPVSILEVITFNINNVNSSALSKNISIKYPDGIDYIVQSDKDIINVILRNIITNAIKFTPCNGEIVISVRQSGKFLFISVKDSGIGITEENMKKIFRSDEMHTTIGTNNEGGTGLGLILCKEFSNKLGGEIYVESEYGSGAKFTFSIPMN